MIASGQEVSALLFYSADKKAAGVGMNLAAIAANSITGISVGGNTIISSNTVASGFFRVCPTSAAVTTDAQKTAFKPKNRLMAQPTLTPQKMTGKK